jgi:hypothetical protein
MREADLFAGAARVTMHEAMEMTAASLNAYGPTHAHWFVAWSGGKDSTATLVTILRLIETGIVPRPASLTVLYADTRQGDRPRFERGSSAPQHLVGVHFEQERQLARQLEADDLLRLEDEAGTHLNLRYPSPA